MGEREGKEGGESWSRPVTFETDVFSFFLPQPSTFVDFSGKGSHSRFGTSREVSMSFVLDTERAEGRRRGGLGGRGWVGGKEPEEWGDVGRTSRRWDSLSFSDFILLLSHTELY